MSVVYDRSKIISLDDESFRSELLGIASKMDDVIPLGRGDPDFHTPSFSYQFGLRNARFGLRNARLGIRNFCLGIRNGRLGIQNGCRISESETTISTVSSYQIRLIDTSVQ